MKPILKYTLIGLLVVVVAGVSIAGIAYAEGDFPKGREALAELLGLTEDELKEQLEGGKTLEDLANEAGVDLEAFREEMQETRLAEMESRIKEALAEDEISQDQADWLLEGLEKGFMSGKRMFGGPPSMGHFRGQEGSRTFGDRPEFDGDCRPGPKGRTPQADQ